jgi:hypothetical protein
VNALPASPPATEEEESWEGSMYGTSIVPKLPASPLNNSNSRGGRRRHRTKHHKSKRVHKKQRKTRRR